MIINISNMLIINMMYIYTETYLESDGSIGEPNVGKSHWARLYSMY
jgi:hypothetical protein